MRFKNRSSVWNLLAASFFVAIPFAALADGVRDPTTEAEIDVRLEVYRAADLRVTPIDFGTVLINGEGGVLSMDSSGELTSVGGILETFDGPSGPAAPGTLTLDANVGATASISLDPLVELGGGVTFFPKLDSTDVPMTGAPVTVILYGEVLFPENTQTGTYDGILNVNVNYYGAP